jgi:hypothetical protein
MHSFLYVASERDKCMYFLRAPCSGQPGATVVTLSLVSCGLWMYLSPTRDFPIACNGPLDFIGSLSNVDSSHVHTFNDMRRKTLSVMTKVHLRNMSKYSLTLRV